MCRTKSSLLCLRYNAGVIPSGVNPMPAIPVSYFDQRADPSVEMLRRFIEIASPSTDKVAVDRFGAAVAGELRALGAAVEIDSQTVTGDHLIGRLGEGEGPGAVDMKGSIVQTLVALRALVEHGKMPRRSVTALFTSDEEIGSNTSRALIERLGAQAGLVVCMEPALTDGSLKTWRKGIGGFEIVVRGRATHAGADHENGVNAIAEMAHQVAELQRLTDYGKGTTVNVGVIGGGTRSNVVPDACRIEVDVRVMTPQDADEIRAAITSLRPVNPKASITVTGGMNRPPMPRT